ncbi:hypothetical protein JGU66_26080 [Myxococcaceae bacterium JPH2]|nr:hypothetical protein [Myxococcaceae bacterium JPH2]
MFEFPRLGALVSTLSLLLLVLCSAPAAAQGGAPPTWGTIEQQVRDQKLEAAAKGTEARLAQAKARADEAEWTRALVRTVQLRTALHGYETAVRFLREQPWPKGVLSRATLNLVYANALVTYASAYSWEVRQREQVTSTGPVDLKSWTHAQILTEANRAYADVWKEREALGAESVKALAEYIEPNTYPAGIRSTLRDAVTYLWVGLLADSSNWLPDQSNEVFRLDPKTLLEQSPSVAMLDPAVHPLVKVTSLLGDLEAWHRAGGRREATLEARLKRYEILHSNFSEAEDKARVRRHLAAFLPGFRDTAWWAMGQGQLADFENAADHGVRAHALAAECAAAYPESVGGERCLTLQKSMEAPTYALEAMRSDGAGKRSLEVTHRNLPTLYFRAFALDVDKQLSKVDDYNLLPYGDSLRHLIETQRPVATWSTALPATTDFRDHRTFVAPPLTKPGTYVIAASAREDFKAKGNRVLSVAFTVTPWVLISRMENGTRLSARVVDGATGKPVSEVELRLVLADYRQGFREVATRRTDPRGEATFESPEGLQFRGFFLVAGRGPDALVNFGSISFQQERPPESDELRTLVFTDRSIYRPTQKVSWKVVSFRGRGDQARYQTQPDARVTVSLMDPNYQVVETREVRTNGFGSVAGEFTIPTGRVLGAWQVSTDPAGTATIRVEEYKRPTFEVTLKDADGSLRLNRPATFQGEARYYFGLPVASGTVRWRVSREPVLPWWWFWSGFGRVNTQPQVVASGTSALGDDGSFKVTFTPEADERSARSPELSWRYRVEADATDEGGETRSASRAFRLGFVAVEGRVDTDEGFIREGSTPEVRLMRSTLDGTPLAGAGRWRLVALKQPATPVLPAEEPMTPATAVDTKDPDVVVTPTPGDALRPRWAEPGSAEGSLHAWADGAEQAQGNVQHGADGVARVKLPALRPGAYRLHYETLDAFGQKFTTAKELLVAGDRAPIALPSFLSLEHPSVRVGEVARLLAFSGFEGQPMVLELYQGERRIERRELTGGRSPAVVEIPVTEALRGGFTAVLSTVRDWQFMHTSQTVLVPYDNKELSVEFATFRDTLRPGAKETFRVSVKGPKGAKVEAGAAELLAYMYDQSLDLFGPHQPPAVADLYPQRAGWVGFGSTLGQMSASWAFDSGLGSIPSWSPPEPDRLRFEEGYGIGGPGQRYSGLVSGTLGGVRRKAMRSADSEFARAPGAPPPPPAPPGEVREESRAAALAGDESAVATNAKSAGGASAQAAPAVAMRSRFEETAFWIPQVLTGPDGSASLEFTVPDSVTAWSVWVHALTRDLKGGSVQRTTRSVKELMVRPYVPRFLREGDSAVLEVVVNNASTQPQQGTLTLDILDPETQKGLLADFGVSNPSQSFTVAPGKGTHLRFALTTPTRVGPVAFRVVARTAGFSDGELRPLPVLPGRMHLAQSRFVTLHGKDKKVMTFDDLRKADDPSRVNEQLVVTVDTQLFYSALQALPYLVNYPYECTEQTLNRFVSSGILSSLYSRYPAVATMAKKLSQRPTRFETWDAVDPNRKMALEETPWLQTARGGEESEGELVRVLDPRVANAERAAAMDRLVKSQTSSGGFPWWPGGPPSPYMTLYIVHGLSRAMEYGVEVPQDMTQRAWGYLARHFREEYASKLMKKDTGWEFLTFLNYTASAYPDSNYTGQALTTAERQRILDFSFKHWKEHSPYLKGYLALTLHRSRREKDAQRVWDSVMDSAKTSEELGTYWAPEDRGWLWYNDTTESHAFALGTLMELRPKDARRDGLVQWLLLDKKLNHWKSTRATAEALYALVKYLEAEGALGVREDARVTVGPKVVEMAFSPEEYTGKKNQVVLQGPEVSAATATTVVEKTTPGFAFASTTWSFSTEKLPEEERGDFFHVSRRYFRRVHEGREATLKPLEEGAVLQPGDEVEVQLSLRAKHAAEYVHLRDPRAAGLEPENAQSRHKWDLGIVWYEETRDSGTNFFFEWLPAGEYTFKYRLRANMAGTFRVSPATVQSMYAPEFTAYSTGARLTVAPSK